MTSQRKFTPEEIRQRMIANRMTVANPPSAPELANRSTIRLKITDVEPYNHNPRTKQNEKFYEIKESIRHNGIEQKVLITKRPGAASYIVAKGGNTRVLAARAVWDETQEERHLWYDFDYIEYTNEVELVAGHLRENDQRSDLCFWDRAEGYMALKQLLEEQGGKDISLREFSRILEEQGTRVSPPLLTVFRFAVDNLSGLGPGTTKLSKNDVQERIQPALASLTRLATKLQMPEAWVTTEILGQCLELARLRHEQVGEVDVPGLVESFYQKAAALLAVPRPGVDTMLHLLDKVPDMTPETLRSAAVGVSARHGPVGGQGDGQQAPLLPEDNRPGDGGRVAEHKPSVPTPGPAPTSRIQGSVERPLAANPGRPPADDRFPPAATLPGISLAPDDPQAHFWDVLTRFANACGLADCLRETDRLPLGFLIEPPELPDGEPPLDAQAAEGIAPQRYYGWWWLVHLSQQNTPAGLCVVPEDSYFAQCSRSEDTWRAACDAVLGEPVLADRFYRLVLAMLDPLDEVGELHLQLIIAVRALRTALPERFKPAFWIAQGVDPRLVEVEV